MRCVRVHRARRAIPCMAALLALGSAAERVAAQQYPGYPQQPYPTYPVVPQYPQPTIPGGQPGQPAVLPPYRLPVITIAQPAEGIALPDDKPVVVLRFASVESLDPLDALSFTLTVDGEDRTALFQLAQGEAWGRLSMPGELLSAGEHAVCARVCTSHGVCGSAKATVNVVPFSSMSQLSAGTSSSKTSQRRSRVFDAVLQAMRVLIH
jgi:hypothetical protein